jgi:hypothetical protein
MCYIKLHMIRKQVYLTEEQARDIKLQARREKKCESEVIRDLVNKGLNASRSASRETAGEALLRLARLGEKLQGKAPPTCPRGLVCSTGRAGRPQHEVARWSVEKAV